MPLYKTLRRRLHSAAARRSPQRFPIVVVIILLFALGFLITQASGFLKDVATQMALSDATDIITSVVNEKINEKMSEGKYDYDYFVTLQKDESGDITAISANMTRINSLASEILREVISSTTSGAIDIGIPIGNLTGSNILLGRGPKIPVKVIMLTSSFADFRNEIAAAGINQIRHQIILELTVEIDVLMPWHVESTKVLSEVLIAETIIVGSVPDTYLSLNTP
jgi:sporulation protein YunB